MRETSKKKSWNGAARSIRVADLSREMSRGAESPPPFFRVKTVRAFTMFTKNFVGTLPYVYDKFVSFHMYRRKTINIWTKPKKASWKEGNCPPPHHGYADVPFCNFKTMRLEMYKNSVKHTVLPVNDRLKLVLPTLSCPTSITRILWTFSFPCFSASS